MVLLETKTYIPRFVECSKCNRSFDFDNDSLWSNQEERICRCCQCKINEGIETCKRVSCNFHSRLQDDFILDVDENDVRDNKHLSAVKETHSLDMENCCAMCQEEIPKDYLYNFLNIKHSFNGVTRRIKVKLCQECFEEFQEMFNLNRIKENDNSEEGIFSLSETREDAA